MFWLLGLENSISWAWDREAEGLLVVQETTCVSKDYLQFELGLVALREWIKD